jgi:hypothetical protein
MATANALLLEYINLIRRPDDAVSLFAVDASIEIPYLTERGLPGRLSELRAVWGKGA